MKKVFICSILMAIMFFYLQAIEVPYSREPVLEDSNLIDDFVRIDPDDLMPESLKTKAWIWQDDNKLMIHFRCAINETFATGYSARRDEYIGADYVRVQLITMPDTYFSYVFMAYPSGHLVDGIRREDMNIDNQWNSNYSYESSYNDSLWNVTFTIPLGSLRFRNTVPYHFYLILTRYNQASNETYSSPYAHIKQKRNYFYSAHEIILHQPITKDIDLKIKPYFVKSYDLVNKTTSFDPDMLGVDIAFKPASDMNVKLSINPDFSDVPPDDAMNIYNLDIPYLYEENRFFFIEDMDAFGVDNTVFYSRNINKPTFAYKATGTSGKNKWGILGAFDEKVMQDGQIINYDDYFQIISFIPKFAHITLGNALVSRTNKGYYNHLYNGNYDIQLTDKLLLKSSVIGSIRKDEQAEENSIKKGYFADCSLNYYPGNFDNSIYYSKTSKDIYADAGYLYYKNRQCYGISSSWTSKPGYGFLKKMTSFLSVDFSDWFHNNETSSECALYGNLIFDLKPKLRVNLQANYGNIFDDFWQEHYYYEINSTITLDKWTWFYVAVNLGNANTLIYTLNETYQQNRLITYIQGYLAQKFFYLLSWNFNKYDYPRKNIVDYGSGPIEVQLDDQYSVINAKIQYNPNLYLGITTGLGFSNYESEEVFSHISYYVNLRYEFKRNCFFYMGYKTNQTQVERFSSTDILGRFTKDTATFFVKVSITIPSEINYN